MRAAEVSFVGALVQRFPVLKGLLQQHLDDYDGLLPHVLMGEVTRWLISEFRKDNASPVVREFLGFMETAFANREEHDRELIAVSFLENLPRIGEPGEELRRALGPALRRQLDIMT